MTELDFKPIPARVKDITGNRYARLVVLGFAGGEDGNSYRWYCLCDCGNICKAIKGELNSGHKKSCGCYNREVTAQRNRDSKTHGGRVRNNPIPEYAVWQSMKSRCHNPHAANYRLYGGRGIRVCDRWINNFEAFFQDMGQRPTNKHQIERIDNDKNYSPDNCKWATVKEQSSNRRTNRLLTFEGITMPMCDWAEKVGLPYTILNKRIQLGMSVEKALTIKLIRRPSRKRD